jgi:hypothetical protein
VEADIEQAGRVADTRKQHRACDEWIKDRGRKTAELETAARRPRAMVG